ncbi:MAG: hypothetical protein WDO74_10555 [Pseudomonadota bacterium]
MYALSGVPEPLIINLRERCIEVHAAPLGRADAAVARVEHGQSLHPSDFRMLKPASRT